MKKQSIMITTLSSLLLLSACQSDEVKNKPSDIKINETKSNKDITTEEPIINNNVKEVNRNIDDKTKSLAEKKITLKDYKKLSKKEENEILKARYLQQKEENIKNSNNKYEAYAKIHRDNSDSNKDIIIDEEIKNTEPLKNKMVINELQPLLIKASQNAKNYMDVMGKSPKNRLNFADEYTYRDENIYATDGFITLSYLGYTIKPSTIKVYEYDTKKNIYQWSAQWYNKNNQLGGTTVGYFTRLNNEIRLINNNYSKLAEKQYDNFKMTHMEINIVNSQ